MFAEEIAQLTPEFYPSLDVDGLISILQEDPSDIPLITEIMNMTSNIAHQEEAEIASITYAKLQSCANSLALMAVGNKGVSAVFTWISNTGI